MMKFSTDFCIIILYVYKSIRSVSNVNCKILRWLMLTSTYCFDFGEITECFESLSSTRKKSCGSKIAMV